MEQSRNQEPMQRNASIRCILSIFCQLEDLDGLRYARTRSVYSRVPSDDRQRMYGVGRTVTKGDKGESRPQSERGSIPAPSSEPEPHVRRRKDATVANSARPGAHLTMHTMLRTVSLARICQLYHVSPRLHLPQDDVGACTTSTEDLVWNHCRLLCLASRVVPARKISVREVPCRIGTIVRLGLMLSNFVRLVVGSAMPRQTSKCPHHELHVSSLAGIICICNKPSKPGTMIRVGSRHTGIYG